MISKAFQNIVFATLFGIILLSPVPAQAYALANSYIPPEMAYADDLHQKVRISERVNLNTMNLLELKNLPGLGEDLALKIMRNRPFTDVQDFYKRMPSNNKQIQLFVQQFQPRLKF